MDQNNEPLGYAGISASFVSFYAVVCARPRALLPPLFVLPHHKLQLPNYVTYSAGHFQEMQNKNLGGFMPLIHVLWYLDKYLLVSAHADAVVVVDDTPAMAPRIAMSDESGRTKVAFLAVSAIKQKDLANAFGGALQHALIMR